ncbi:large conductance mechanosensitive channel protein MscL [Pilimelia columellifera]|uniref:Large-conductance mechanosensitive channel n=1 Tax=Pilimelia columellifera subsp. columellifera TaxID=706583 RepID=A0ABP6A8X9_9ACTN
MLKGFKDFIMRGNVVDLAVGVVIGAAFTAVVTQLTKSFLEPLIKLASGGEALAAGQWVVKEAPDGSPLIAFAWAAFVNQVVTFLLTAAVIYFVVVLPLNKLAERRKKGVEPESKAPSEDVILLTEIRDLLRQRG